MELKMSRMLKYVFIFFFILFAWYGIKKAFFAIMISNYKPPAVTVSATNVQLKPWKSYLTTVGSLEAVNGVELAPEVAGTIQEIRFNSGQLVKKGDVLILLDSAIEQASLKDSLAKLKLAQMNYERTKTLFDKHVASQSLLDTNYAELQEAEAGVQTIEARIKQKTILAPFDGKIGIKQINIGQYVSPGTGMVTLQSLNPLYVMFNLPEQTLPYLYIHQPIEVSINYGDGKTIKGEITAINAKVNADTRNVLIQATIPNNNLQLYPGMFASVKVWHKNQQKILVIPQTAISYSLSGDYVFAIKKESGKKDLLRVVRQYIKTGERHENEVTIVSGLKAGDQVVTSGQLKLQNGMPVLIDNSVEL